MNDNDERKEYCIRLLEEILYVNDHGGFNDYGNPPTNINYGYLMALLNLRGEVDGIDDLYYSLYSYAIEAGKEAVLNKRKNGEKIRVVFLIYSASQWSVDSLYKELFNDDRFEVIILLAPLIERSKEDAIHTYSASCDYFNSKGYDYIDSFDLESMMVLDWESSCGIPDILIHLSSWNEGMPECYSVTELPLTTLNIYIPYAMYTVNSVDGNFIKELVYDKPFMNLMWQIYVPFEQDKIEYSQYEYLKGENVVVGGYPKMDSIIFPNKYLDEDIKRLWKIPEGKRIEEIKKVIISPHYTIMYGGDGLSLSTFHENAYFLLYLAKKYSDRISFVFKPHPNLRMNAVRLGFFANHKQYDDYINEWNSLPNCKVVDESEYTDWFVTSDGCINDSGSFLLEYQFTGKPMLYLRKESQRLRSSINHLTDIVYNVDGGDYCGIEGFLDDVIINGKDTLDSLRKDFFENGLFYDQEQKSGTKIYKNICDQLFES